MAEYIWCLRLLTAHGLCSLAGRTQTGGACPRESKLQGCRGDWISITGFLRSGKVREFWVSQGKSGKTERVREKSGNFKIPLTRPIIYALFSQFSPACGGFTPRPLPGLRPKHCMLVYIAIFLQWNKIYYYICVLSIVLLVSRIKKLVGENYSFCLEKSGKMNSAK